jgi:hypothetical protein
MVLTAWRLLTEQQLVKDVLEWCMPAKVVPVAKAAPATAIVGSAKKLAVESAKLAAVVSDLARGAWC